MLSSISKDFFCHLIAVLLVLFVYLLHYFYLINYCNESFCYIFVILTVFFSLEVSKNIIQFQQP